MTAKPLARVAWMMLVGACSAPVTGSSGGGGGDDGSAGGGGGSALGPGLALRGGTIVDPAAQTATQADLFICGGVIVDATTSQRCTLTDIDVTGKWLIPGLIDMHVHARGVSLGNEDFVDWTIAQEAAVFESAGVVGFLDSMNDEAKIFPARAAQRAQATPSGADIFCAGGAFTPTGGHGTEYGFPKTSYHIVDTAAEATAQVDALAASAPDIVKVMYDHRGDDGAPDVKDGQTGALGVAMSKDVMIAVVAEAKAKGLKVQVHTGVWSDAAAAIAAGAPMIAHLGEPAIPDDVVAAAKAAGAYWLPTLTLYHGLPDLIADQSLLDDPLLAKVLPADVIASYRTAKLRIDKYTTAWLARHTLDFANVKKLHESGVKLLAGTDAVELGAFPGWSLHRELKLLVDAGLSPYEALATATTNAGEFLGHAYGTAPGDEGNIVVLDASPIADITNTTKIQMVIHHGAVVPSP